MLDRPPVDDPLQALHIDNADRPSTVGAKRPVSRSGTEDPAFRGLASPKTTNIVVEDSVFVDALARRLDRISRQPSSENLFEPKSTGSHRSSGSGTPRTPTEKSSGRKDSSLFQGSSPTSSKKSSGKQSSPSKRRSLALGLREVCRAPRSLFSLIGNSLQEVGREVDHRTSHQPVGSTESFLSADEFPFFAPSESCPSFVLAQIKDRSQDGKLKPGLTTQEPERPCTADAASVAASMCNQSGGIASHNSRPNTATAMSLDSPLSTSSDGDAWGRHGDEPYIGLGKIGSRIGDYDKGRNKAMQKSSSAPVLSNPSPFSKKRNEPGDPIILAKRTSAIAASTARCNQLNQVRAQHPGVEVKPSSNTDAKNVLIVATGVTGPKHVVEDLPADTFQLSRAGTAPGGPRRRRCATDRVSSQVGFSPEQFTSDTSTAQGLSGSDWLGSRGGGLRLSASQSMPSLLSSRTFNYFSVKEPRRPVTSF